MIHDIQIVVSLLRPLLPVSLTYCLLHILNEVEELIQSELYYPRYLGVVNFGLKNRRQPRSADNRGANNRGLTVHCTS